MLKKLPEKGHLIFKKDIKGKLKYLFILSPKSRMEILSRHSQNNDYHIPSKRQQMVHVLIATRTIFGKDIPNRPEKRLGGQIIDN